MSTAWKGLLLCAAFGGFGFVAAPRNAELAVEVRAATIRPDLVLDRAAAERDVEVQRDAKTGAVRLMTGALFEGAVQGLGASVSDYAATALAFVDTHAEEFGVASHDLELVPEATLIDKDVQFLSFRVRRDGLLINDAKVAFRFKQGHLAQVMARTFSEAASDARTAVESVAGELSYRVRATSVGYELVRVARRTAELGGEAFNVEVEAATGHVYSRTSRRHLADKAGKAETKAFARTYWQSSPVTLAIPEVNLTANSRTVTTAVDGTFTAAATPAMNGYKGKRASVTPKSGSAVTVQGAVVGNDYLVAVTKTAEKDIAQANAYVHIDKIINRAKSYVSSNWFEGNLKINVNLTETCNAYWDGSSVNFFSSGDGCANTAHISDVMYHEWGHGFDENTGGIDDDAFSEGFGDIMSLAMTHDNILGPGFLSDTGEGVRDLSPDKKYPDDRGEVHDEGLIIGTTFWDMYQALVTARGATAADELLNKYAFKMIFTAEKYTDVYQALLVIDDNDNNQGNKTPNFCSINVAFAQHGLTTRDASCN